MEFPRISIASLLNENPDERMDLGRKTMKPIRTTESHCLPEWFRSGVIRTSAELETIQAQLNVIKATQAGDLDADKANLDVSRQSGDGHYEITQDQLLELQDVVLAALVPDNTGELRASETGMLVTYADGSLDFCHQVLIQVAKDLRASLITLDLEDLEDFAEQFDAQGYRPDGIRASSSDEPDRKTSFNLAKHYFAVPSKDDASEEARERNENAVSFIIDSLREESLQKPENTTRASSKGRPILLHLYGEKVITSLSGGYNVYARFWDTISAKRVSGEPLVLIVSATKGPQISGCSCPSCDPSNLSARLEKEIHAGIERTVALTHSNKHSKSDSGSQTGWRNLRHLKRMLRRRMPRPENFDPRVDWIQTELFSGIEAANMANEIWPDEDIQRAVTQIVGRLWRSPKIDYNDVRDILSRLGLYSRPVERVEPQIASSEDGYHNSDNPIDPSTSGDESIADDNSLPEVTSEVGSEEKQNNEIQEEYQRPNAWPIEESMAQKEWEEQKKSRGETNKALDEIMNMIGLEPVKRRFMEIKNLVDTASRQGIKLKEEYFGTIFYGNPGTGKTTVAAMYARLLSSLHIVPGRQLKTTTGIKLGNGGIRECERLIKDIEDSDDDDSDYYNSDSDSDYYKTGGGVILVDEAHELLSAMHGRSVLEYLTGEVERLRGKVVFVFAGYPRPMESFLSSSPGLQSRIPLTINFEDYKDGELHRILVQLLGKKFSNTMRVEEGINGLFMRILVRRIGRARGRTAFANARQVHNTLNRILTRQAQRLALSRRNKEEADDFFLTKTDVVGPPPSTALEESDAWKNLQAMTGLASVKEEIQGLLNQLQINYDRELAEQPPIECSLNKVFLGNPGTGKTTVAKYYGQILADIGLLSNGEVMVRTPADFAGSYLGEAEKNTKSILASAEGKVLIIDEAYGLFEASDDGTKTSSANTYKTAVIDTIVAEVQNTPNEDRCVLLLGYKDRMETMFQNVNPALARRFPLSSAFNFTDYSDQEMGEILERKLQVQGLTATDDAKEIAMGVLSRTRHQRNYGNAGEVDNLLDQAKIRQQKRLRPPYDIEGDDLSHLRPEDFDPDFDRAQRAQTSIRQIMQDFVGADTLIEKLEDYQRIVQNAKVLNLDARSQVPFTFLFRGPPGTGKTTMARRMGQVFYNLGLLGTTEVIDCSTTDLIGEYVGQTGPKTKRLLQRALGKVLFIDEAYHLSRSGFGCDAVVEMMNLLTQDKYQNKIVTILAGYDEDIDRMLAINDGFSSRFPETISFNHITPLHAYELLIRSLHE